MQEGKKEAIWGLKNAVSTLGSLFSDLGVRSIKPGKGGERAADL